MSVHQQPSNFRRSGVYFENEYYGKIAELQIKEKVTRGFYSGENLNLPITKPT